MTKAGIKEIEGKLLPMLLRTQSLYYCHMILAGRAETEKDRKFYTTMKECYLERFNTITTIAEELGVDDLSTDTVFQAKLSTAADEGVELAWNMLKRGMI